MGTRTLDEATQIPMTTTSATTTAEHAAEINCREFDLLLSEVLLRSELPAAGQQHLTECETCAAILDDIEAIAERVRRLPSAEAEPVPDLWPQILERLRSEGVIHGETGCGGGTPRLVHSRDKG